MNYRDPRHRCSYAVRFSVGRESFVGEIRSVSRSGLLARTSGRVLRRGERVRFVFNRQERSATVVRLAAGHAGLRFEWPLTKAEFDEIALGPRRRRQRGLRL